jgi:cytochrome P450
VQAHTTQRDPAYFPSPNTFDPTRWIDEKGAINPGTPDQREMWLVWGKGTRVCLGQHMATMEQKITLARLMERFRVKLASPKTHEEMEMTDHFTLIPKGQKCSLVFEEVE